MIFLCIFWRPQCVSWLPETSLLPKPPCPTVPMRFLQRRQHGFWGKSPIAVPTSSDYGAQTPRYKKTIQTRIYRLWGGVGQEAGARWAAEANTPVFPFFLWASFCASTGINAKMLGESRTSDSWLHCSDWTRSPWRGREVRIQEWGGRPFSRVFYRSSTYS